MKCYKITSILIFSFLLFSCKNYYNETIEWVDTLEQGISIENVQNIQPNYIEIDWKTPQIFNNQKWYLITKIKGNNDMLSMSNYLVFVNDRYQERISKK